MLFLVTNSTSRVVVEANADPGEDITQMQKLSNHILEIVTDHELQVAIKNDATAHLKGGRPRNDANDYAYYEVNILGKSPSQVYPGWLKRRGETISLLMDPKDSFRKAIRKKPK